MLGRRKFLRLAAAAMITAASTTGFGRTKLTVLDLEHEGTLEVAGSMDVYFESKDLYDNYMQAGDFLTIEGQGIYKVMSCAIGEKTHCTRVDILEGGDV